MAKGEHIGLYLGLLIAGLFYVYYRHEQQTQGGTVPPVSHGGPGPQIDAGGILGGILNLFGGGSPAGGNGGAPAAPARGRGGGPPAGVPDVCNHLTLAQMQQPHFQQMCHTDFSYWLHPPGPTGSRGGRGGPAGRGGAIHPTGVVAGQTVSPQDLWTAALQSPGQQAAFYARGCQTCPGSRTGTWFDQEEPPPYMQSYPRYESYGNVGEI